MNTKSKRHDAADGWHHFLEKLEAGYRRMHSLERDLHAITEEADAFRNELARIADEVMSLEAFMEQCRSRAWLIKGDL